eukprot:TRINITY_DN1044_c1_g1_i4.p1 TRINITY_DN1044_c1_g1~~TRINITY_DN1044_c1_g1_i4.p1  ORF type:complete len:334 (-),score=94.85 TRINITY_DN1044_c1_g1_i4:460-1461(-)
MKGRRHGSDGVGHRRRVPGAKEEGGEKTTIPRAGRCLGGGGGNGSTVAARQEEREEEEEGTEEEVPLEAVNATVVSALFWPTLQSEEVELPPPVSRALSAFAARFSTLRAPRQLRWLPTLGSVTLDLEFDDGESAEFTVLPFQAAVIMLFQRRPTWTAAEIAAELHCPLANVRRRGLGFWIPQGILLEGSNASQEVDAEEDAVPLKPTVTYTIITSLAARNGGPLGGGGGVMATAMEEDGGDGGEDGGEGSADAMQQELQALEGVQELFVTGMLATFADGLPLERIHNMLKMFITEPLYEKTLPQLLAMLNKLIGEDKIEVRDNLYRKRNSGE